MMADVLFYIHYAFLLLFGIILSALFSGVRFSKKSFLGTLGAFLICAALQIFFFFIFGEEFTKRLYPIITHVPTVLLLCLFFGRKLVTSLASVTTAYFLCQPANWFGILAFGLTENCVIECVVRILVLLLVSVVAFVAIGPSLSAIYNKETKNVLVFGSIPFVYYLYDYAFNVYTSLIVDNERIVIEFMPFFLCVVFVLLCCFYYKEYEERADAERKEQIIRITVEQQAKELEAVQRSEHEIRLLRHDMRMMMNSLSVCIAENDVESAKRIVSGFTSGIDKTSVVRYCDNTIVNYILSDYAAKCEREGVKLEADVAVEKIEADEIMLASVISNALDNALNAQFDVEEGRKHIKLILKTLNGKLLLSLANTCAVEPIFAEGMPVSQKKGHGYGTQSIRYMTERMGGNCQFKTENGDFVLRVVI